MTARLHALIVSALWETTNRLGVALRSGCLLSKEFRTFLRAKIEEDAAIIDCSADQDDLFHYTGTYGTLYCRVRGGVKCWKLQVELGSVFEHILS